MLTGIDRLFRATLLASAAFLFFIGGALSTYFTFFPYPWISHAHTAFLAMQERERVIEEALAAPEPRKTGKRTAFINKPGAYQGHTLFTTLRPGAALVNMEGEIVYEWERPFSKTWTNPSHVKNPLPDRMIYWRDAHLFPNGDLLVVNESDGGDTPYGYGLAKIDKNSDLIWHYDSKVHHRVYVDGGGTIYGLTHVFSDAESLLGIEDHDPPNILEEFFVILSADGKELSRGSITKALLASPYKDALLRQFHDPGDKVHPNSIVPLEPEMAKAFPMFKPGQLLISMRNISAVGVLDPEQGDCATLGNLR
jgi:hypothetical protein